MKIRKPRWLMPICFAAVVAATPCAVNAEDTDHARPPRVEQAIMLSPFGGRAAFSPDGKKIAFVGKTYGDAYEIDIATRQVRNLTRDVPHQGIMRIQYLPSGDYLITAPRRNTGVNTRAHLEMWVLDKELRRGLQPLGEQVFEGIAVSRKSNRVAWTVVEPELKPGEGWQLAFVRPTKRYVANVNFENGFARLVGKREIMPTLPRECGFIEPQDFRDDDKELVYSCMGTTSGGVLISVMGHKLGTGQNVTYRRRAGEYNEVEGIHPSGDWATVECGKQDKPGLPPLDICRLELRPGGEMTPLVTGTVPGQTGDVSNPVVSPDGKWLAFQRSDHTSGDIGEGYGLYLLPLED
jgi:hypothetical protein